MQTDRREWTVGNLKVALIKTAKDNFTIEAINDDKQRWKSAEFDDGVASAATLGMYAKAKDVLYQIIEKGFNNKRENKTGCERVEFKDQAADKMTLEVTLKEEYETRVFEIPLETQPEDPFWRLEQIIKDKDVEIKSLKDMVQGMSHQLEEVVQGMNQQYNLIHGQIREDNANMREVVQGIASKVNGVHYFLDEYSCFFKVRKDEIEDVCDLLQARHQEIRETTNTLIEQLENYESNQAAVKNPADRPVEVDTPQQQSHAAVRQTYVLVGEHKCISALDEDTDVAHIKLPAGKWAVHYSFFYGVTTCASFIKYNVMYGSNRAHPHGSNGGYHLSVPLSHQDTPFYPKPVSGVVLIDANGNDDVYMRFAKCDKNPIFSNVVIVAHRTC